MTVSRMQVLWLDIRYVKLLVLVWLEMPMPPDGCASCALYVRHRVPGAWGAFAMWNAVKQAHS